MSEQRAAFGGQGDLRTILLIIYGVFLLATVNGATAIAGVVLAYIKRDAARGTMWEGHFRNIIHVFWIAFAIFVIAVAILLQAFGGLAYSLFTTNGNPPPALIGSLIVLAPLFWLGGVLFFVWYLYRMLRGFIRTLDAKPY